MALPKPANRDGKIGASGSLVIYGIIHAWHQLFLVVPKEPIKYDDDSLRPSGGILHYRKPSFIELKALDKYRYWYRDPA